jgi:hypothetical protein
LSCRIVQRLAKKNAPDFSGATKRIPGLSSGCGIIFCKKVSGGLIPLFGRFTGDEQIEQDCRQAGEVGTELERPPGLSPSAR